MTGLKVLGDKGEEEMWDNFSISLVFPELTMA